MTSVAATTPSAVDGTPGGVLVIGGGLAGVSLALFLHRRGVRVRVFEAWKALSDTAGLCLQLGPNGVAVVEALQMSAVLLERGVASSAFRIVDESGVEMCTVPLHSQQQFGNHTLMVQRSHLHRLLAHALEAEGCLIAYDHQLTRIEQSSNSSTVTATFANGSAATGELLVGCDGVRSRTRELLFPSAPEVVYQGYLGVSSFLPMSALADDERHTMRLSDGVLNMTRGPAGVVLAAAAGNDAQGEPLLLLVVKAPVAVEEAEKAREMSNEQLLEGELRPRFGGWSAPVPRLLVLLCAPSARRPLVWPSFAFNEELPSWHAGRAVLIGDAAHSSVPDGQGASLALEDAQYLASLLAEAYASSPTTAPSIAALSAACEQLHAHRAPRVKVINEEARTRNRSLVAGPTMGAWKQWLMKQVMPWLLWLLGARIFDTAFRSGYKIPGYAVVPPRAERTDAEGDEVHATPGKPSAE